MTEMVSRRSCSVLVLDVDTPADALFSLVWPLLLSVIATVDHTSRRDSIAELALHSRGMK